MSLGLPPRPQPAVAVSCNSIASWVPAHSSLLLLLIKFSVSFQVYFPWLSWLAWNQPGAEVARSLGMAGGLGDDEGGVGEWPFPFGGRHPSTFLMPGLHILVGALSWPVVRDLLSPLSARPASPFPSQLYLLVLPKSGTETHFLQHKASPAQASLPSPSPSLRSRERMGSHPSISDSWFPNAGPAAASLACEFSVAIRNQSRPSSFSRRGSAWFGPVDKNPGPGEGSCVSAPSLSL